MRKQLLVVHMQIFVREKSEVRIVVGTPAGVVLQERCVLETKVRVIPTPTNTPTAHSTMEEIKIW